MQNSKSFSTLKHLQKIKEIHLKNLHCIMQYIDDMDSWPFSLQKKGERRASGSLFSLQLLQYNSQMTGVVR
jgi:hypothetical protein